MRQTQHHQRHLTVCFSAESRAKRGVMSVGFFSFNPDRFVLNNTRPTPPAWSARPSLCVVSPVVVCVVRNSVLSRWNWGWRWSTERRESGVTNMSNATDMTSRSFPENDVLNFSSAFTFSSTSLMSLIGLYFLRTVQSVTKRCWFFRRIHGPALEAPRPNQAARRSRRRHQCCNECVYSGSRST